MQETRITNATSVGVSVSMESLQDSASEVYLNCGGAYYKGNVISGFRKEKTTVNVEGVFVAPSNTSGPQDMLGAISDLAGTTSKTTLQIESTDGAISSFGEGEITNFTLSEGAHVNESLYSLTFETEGTKLSEGYDNVQSLLLDPAKYNSIDESFGYSQDIQAKTWEISHDLHVVPNNQSDYTTKNEIDAQSSSQADGLVNLAVLQIGQNYIQNAMLSEQPPFPLSSALGGVLGSGCPADNFDSPECKYVLNYSYSNSYDLICGGSRTSKTISLEASGTGGYNAVHDVNFNRGDNGIVMVTLNGTITPLRQDRNENGEILKSYLDYAQEGYAIETGLAPGRMIGVFEEFKSTTPAEDAPLINKFIEKTKNIDSPDKDGVISYSLSQTNDPAYLTGANGSLAITSKNTSTDYSYTELCEGSKILVTSINQSVSVEGCGAPVNENGDYVKYNNATGLYNELLAGAAAEISGMYTGSRTGDWKQRSLSEDKSFYKGMISYNMTWDDSPGAVGDVYANHDPSGCYSWETSIKEIPSWVITSETDSLEGLMRETKTTGAGQKDFTINMKEGTGDCTDILASYLSGARKLYLAHEGLTGSGCFLSHIEWGINKRATTQGDFDFHASVIQKNE